MGAANEGEAADSATAYHLLGLCTHHSNRTSEAKVGPCQQFVLGRFYSVNCGKSLAALSSLGKEEEETPLPDVLQVPLGRPFNSV